MSVTGSDNSPLGIPSVRDAPRTNHKKLTYEEAPAESANREHLRKLLTPDAIKLNSKQNQDKGLY